MPSKAEIRDRLRKERAEMSTAEVIKKSQLILAGVQTILQNLTFDSLHCFEPIAKLHEVDVSPLFDTPDATLYTSRKIAGKWQVVSVNDGEVVKDPQLDVVIVPMLGFDKKLQRIGYGGGYYDRLLAEHPKAIKIGVCFEQGRLESVPAEAYDIPLDIIVTDVTATIAI